MRIYQLQRVIPAPPPSGCAEEATTEDAGQLHDWGVDFLRVTGDTDQSIQRALAERRFWLWKDPHPVSVAGFGGPTPHGVRISFVYTPPKHRGRGYATANVAALSQRLLDSGRTFCFLFADLANPTANTMYQRIGYEKVCDCVEYRFVSGVE
jgi:predicted GNAT family acetyltransferase